eukprot:2658729-Pyramimonas_sp.AAC.1
MHGRRAPVRVKLQVAHGAAVRRRSFSRVLNIIFAVTCPFLLFAGLPLGAECPRSWGWPSERCRDACGQTASFCGGGVDCRRREALELGRERAPL